jgi:S1-C subfamily serine protease
LQQAFVSVSAKVLPSVVEIRTAEGLGSGIVYDDHGHIVTNHHVVGDATTFTVRLSNGHAYPAKLTGDYAAGDLAVVQISGAKDLHPASFADSGGLKIGTIVLAVGNPLGLEGSVTEGIVSAVGRTMTEPPGPGSPGATLPNTIQTSAPINPGNSGGALVDLKGQVVGIPTLAATSSQEGGAAPGIGFAIPSNVVTDIADQIIKYGEVRNSHRAALGIQATTVYDQGTGSPAGVGIVEITRGGAADQAGLTAGVVIVSINGTQTPTTAALSQVLAELKPGDRAKVGVLTQDGRQRTVTVTLGELPG